MNIILLERMWQKVNIVKPGKPEKESVTVGNISIYKYLEEQKSYILKHRCYTIENGGESSPEANKDRRIMPGTYKLIESKTSVPLPREYVGRGLLLYKDDEPEFAKRRIFIHAGNYPQDTEGCILLQSTYDTSEDAGYGRGSMRAVKKFYDYILNKGVEKFTLHIRDEFNVNLDTFI